MTRVLAYARQYNVGLHSVGDGSRMVPPGLESLMEYCANSPAVAHELEISTADE